MQYFDGAQYSMYNMVFGKRSDGLINLYNIKICVVQDCNIFGSILYCKLWYNHACAVILVLVIIA